MTPEDKMKNLLGRARSDATPTEEEWQTFLTRAHRSVAIRRGLIAGGVVALLTVGVAAGAALTGRTVRSPELPDPAGSPTRSEEARPPAHYVMQNYYEPAPTADPGSVVQVWFLNRSDTAGSRLVPAYRDIGDTVAVARAAMHALLGGPRPGLEESAFTPIPEDTFLLDITIEGGIATVDLSTEFDETGLGAEFEHLPLAQVVFTLTEFDTVEGVVFEIEGERITSYGSHGIPIDKPLTREDFEDEAPPITVERPWPDQQVGTTFQLEGSANVFEATVSYRIRDEDGRLLEEGFTTATCGTGCRGDYSEKITVDVTEKTQAVIEVFESSAEDGSPLHMVRVPVTILP